MPERPLDGRDESIHRRLERSAASPCRTFRASGSWRSTTTATRSRSFERSSKTTGAVVTTADSAQQALDLMERMTPDVLLADLGMPHMSGFELIERVRRSERAEIREMPAVAVTAYARSEDRTRALRSGFQMHLAKPVDPGELMAAAAALVNRSAVGE